MTAARELSQHVGKKRACAALELPRASFYRAARPSSLGAGARRIPARALTEDERQAVIDTLTTPRFVDQAPAEVYATLLDEGTYLCSVRQMYRVLDSRHAVRERRNQLRHPAYQKPELLRTAPNQVWSWDITKLRGPVKWSYYYLYVLLDIFSRFVVGWLLARNECAALARRLIEECCEREDIVPGRLTVHADRGQVPRAKTVGQLLADLEVVKSHSRPHVSNDNPYSESQFKTVKYHPTFPGRFGSLEDGKGFFRRFFAWYNEAHRHSGIGFMTPSAVHHGRAAQLYAARQATLDTVFAARPDRFVRGRPTPPALPDAAWINQPKDESRVRIDPCPTPSDVGIIAPARETGPQATFEVDGAKTEPPGCSRIDDRLRPRPLGTPSSTAHSVRAGCEVRLGELQPGCVLAAQ